MEFKPGDIIKHKSGSVYLITAPKGSDGSKWSVVCLVKKRSRLLPLLSGAGDLIPHSEDNFKQCDPSIWTKLGSLDEL